MAFAQKMDIGSWTAYSTGSYAKPFEAAERGTARTARWSAPQGLSPDAMLRDRDLLNARGGDAVRNDPLGAGYLSHRVESTIGTGLLLQPKPDYTFLGLTAAEARQFRRLVKSQWKQFANDPDKWIDLRRQLNFNQILRQLYTSYVFNSEYILVFEWRAKPDRRIGRAFARTAVNVVHPDLLCNPMGMPDGRLENGNVLRSGVELDTNGAPVAYHFRQGHVCDTTSDATERMEWKRVEAYVGPGRRQVLHVFEQEHPGQTRGRPTFAAALLGLRSLKKFNEAALSAQILQSMYAAVITSQADPQMVGQIMGRGGEGSPADNYIDLQAQHHPNGITFNGAKALSLVPGEDFSIKTPGNVAPNLEAFNMKVIEHLARALPGASYEELSADYKNTSYSSARASSLLPWRFVMGQREHIADPGASAIYSNFFEELVQPEDGRIKLPGNVGFYEAKTAWTYCEWIGAPRGHIDEVKAQEANKLKRILGSLTAERLYAEEGIDIDEQLDDLALEAPELEAAGVPNPHELLTKTDQAAVEAELEVKREAAQKQADARPTRTEKISVRDPQTNLITKVIERQVPDDE